MRRGVRVTTSDGGRRSDRLAIPQLPGVWDFWAGRVQSKHLLGPVRLGRAIGKDHELVAVRLVTVGDPGRDLDEHVVVLAEEYLLQLPVGRRAFPQVVENQLRTARDERVVDGHRLVDVPGLDRTRPGTGEIDLPELDEV